MLPHIPQLPDFIHIKSLRDLPHLLIVLFLVVGIGLGVYLALQPQIFNKRADEGSIIDLKFVPDTIAAQLGGEYEAKIAINPKASRVDSVQLNITYNPEVISILDIENGGFLPVQLRAIDDRQGNLNLIYGSTIESQTKAPGILSTIKFKVLTSDPALFEIKPTSQVTTSEVGGNVLKSYSKLILEPSSVALPETQVRYPDNLLLEKAFFASSGPAIRDFKESLEPKPEIKPGRVKPEFSIAFIAQLGIDIFISPIAALNQVLEEKTGEILGK